MWLAVGVVGKGEVCPLMPMPFSAICDRGVCIVWNVGVAGDEGCMSAMVYEATADMIQIK